MSRLSRASRRLAPAGVATVALLASATSAHAASLTLNYQCTYPLIGPQPLSVKIDAAIPTSTPAGGFTDPFTIVAQATAGGDTWAGLHLIGAATISGSANAKATLTRPGAASLPLTVPIGIQKYTIPSSNQNLVLTAGGSTPKITFANTGTGGVSVDSLSLNLTARDASGKPLQLGTPGVADSDNNPNTFDVPCTLDPPSQSTQLASINVTAPGTTGDTPTPEPTITAEPVPSATEQGSDTTAVNYGYGITGVAALKTLVQGSLPLSGSIAANLNLLTGAFTGDLSLVRTGAQLKALGLLPVTATVEIDPTDQVIGTLKNGVLSATAKVRIKLPWVSLLGIGIAGGTNCQAAQVSTINLKSTDAFFKPLSGGTLAGTFSISNLVGCGYLNGIVSPLTSGNGDSIILGLTPKS